MNRKGFTLVELIATIVVLAMVMGIALVSVLTFFGDAKEKSEEVFVDTIRDAMNVYLGSDAKKLTFTQDTKSGTNCQIIKTYGPVNVYKATINFNAVINSEFKPITKEELVNPANEDVTCTSPSSVQIYRDDDYVYYYSINKSSFGCLKNTSGEYSSVITNLPEGYTCD